MKAVKVRVEWCGICGTDLHEVRRRADLLPDRVAVEPYMTCGVCVYCLPGRYSLWADRGGVRRGSHRAPPLRQDPAEQFITGRIAVDDILESGFRELIHNKDENNKILVHP
ncbi:hypothetical protein [Sinomonas sp. B1-1]|uniref:hypothetical protein n=1 Tax=Sinomonas sp. B1-1 TaxID=3141454 RepID=UPI003D277FFA